MRTPEILLLIALFIPLAGAMLLPGNRRAARAAALVVALAVLALVVVLVVRYPVAARPRWPSRTSPGWAESAPSIDVRFSVGLDGLSLWLFALDLALDGRRRAGELGIDPGAGVGSTIACCWFWRPECWASLSPATSSSSTSSSSSR